MIPNIVSYFSIRNGLGIHGILCFSLNISFFPISEKDDIEDLIDTSLMNMRPISIHLCLYEFL